jgi:hypothetical protein
VLLAQWTVRADLQNATKLDSTNVLKVSVLDSANDQRIAGAKVQFVGGGGRPHLMGNWSTDQTGSQILELPSPRANELKLWTVADGYVPTETAVQRDFAGAFPSVCTVRLLQAVTVGGILLDETGKPLAGVEVFLDSEKKPETNSVSVVLEPHDNFHYEKTNGQGRWICRHAPRRLQTVRFRLVHPEYITVEFAPDSAERRRANEATVSETDLLALRANVFMKGGFTLNGLVLDSNQRPIEGAEVIGPDYPVWTPADGRFSFHNCPAGPISLTAYAKGFAPQRKRILVSEVSNQGQIQLDKGNRVELRVLDSKGRPVSQAQVIAERWQGQPALQWQWETDGQGRFVWDSAPADEVLYTISHFGDETLHGQLLKADGQEQVVVLHKHRQISGRVVDSDTQAPVKAFRVIPGLLHVNHYDWNVESTANGQNGAYLISVPKQINLPVLRIQANGYYPEVSRIFKDDEEESLGDFRLKRGESISGKVQLPDGQPAQRAQVALCTEDEIIWLGEGRFINSDLGHTSKTDDHGEFLFQPRRNVKRIAAVDEQGYAEMPIDAFKQVTIIRLKPWGRIAGVLRHGTSMGTNELVQLVRIGSLCPQLQINSFTRVTDAQGRFTFERVPPGQQLIGRVIQTQFSHGQTINITPGRTAQISLGGTGRTVTGHIASADGRELDWEGGNHPAFLRVNLPQLTIPTLADGLATNAWLRVYGDSADGRARQMSNLVYVVEFKSNSVFQVQDVPAGAYECEIHYHQAAASDREPDVCLGIFKKEVTVPELLASQRDEPVDLGKLIISLKPPPH